MQTNFSPQQLLNPKMASSYEELTACLQCGYCMNNCPTYRLLGDEYDSPRGRIFLIKKMFENDGSPDQSTVEHIDRCMSCMICMASCPSSVNYMHLLDHAREYIENTYKRSRLDRFVREMLAIILPYPGRFRLLIRFLQLVRPLSVLFPEKIQNMVDLIPTKLPRPGESEKSQIFTAIGGKKYRVALMTGCVQKVLRPNINDATIRILRRHGCEVVISPVTGCCGSLVHHMGKTGISSEMAVTYINAWLKEINSKGLDAIIVNTSGCGTTIKEYGYIFRDQKFAANAAIISELTKDITEFLAELDLDYKIKPGLRVAYHATCSLQFGQRLRFLPKKLLKSAGFTIFEPRDPNTCCGAGGTYSLLHPGISEQLKIDKVKSLEYGSPDVIAAGNIGCMVQIRSGTGIPVVHTVELLDWATGGPIPEEVDGLQDNRNPLKVVFS